MEPEAINFIQMYSAETVKGENNYSTPGGFISSTEDGEGFASHSPNRKRKYQQAQTCSDPRLDALIQKVNYMSQYVIQLPQLISQSTQAKDDETSQKPFLIKPTTQSCSSSLSQLGTDSESGEIIPPADKERLEELLQLQQFDSPSWKTIRYKKALQHCLAQPGFVGLKVNEEFSHLNKSKDYLASTEQLLAGLTNNILQQRQFLRSGLQELLDWSSAQSNNINPSSLFEKLLSLFGPGSPSYKNSELALQIICGKRSECIEVRRERILKEVTNPNLRATLCQIPPSHEYIFNPETVQPIVASLGSSKVDLNTRNDNKKRKTQCFNNRKYQRQPFDTEEKQYLKFKKHIFYQQNRGN